MNRITLEARKNLILEYRMDFELKPLSNVQASQTASDALVVLVSAEQLKNLKLNATALEQLLAQASKAGDFDGSAGAVLSCYCPAGLTSSRVQLVGLGKADAKDTAKALTAAIASLKLPKSGKEKKPVARQVVLHWLDSPEPAALQAAMHAAASGVYVYDRTKSKPIAPKLSKLVVSCGTHAALKAAFIQAQASIAGVEFAKEWGNRPANHATPSLLAKAAQGLATRGSGVSCKVLLPAQVAKLKMGSFMAVAQGSREPLRFIELSYQGAGKALAPTVLVGKGITFDTGGISIKPAAEMDEMKFDMCGAASVLGVFKALSLLKPKINVVGLIPACENMPSSTAVKPGDVVTSMSGQTIEILNTDAEGRLILCDALTYAERFKPAAVVDIATLTGACVVALGAVRSGLFSSNDALAEQLLQAGDKAQDLAWRMPLDEDYAEGLKSNFADVANVAGRMGGAITAAKFLQRFTSKFPWAHLDIAGTAWKSGAAKGSTGRPVPLLLEFVLGFKKI
jgi:leucyl aminopeptidase